MNNPNKKFKPRFDIEIPPDNYVLPDNYVPPDNYVLPDNYEPLHAPVVVNVPEPPINPKPVFKLGMTDLPYLTPPTIMPDEKITNIRTFKKPSVLKEWQEDEPVEEIVQEIVDTEFMINRLFLPDQEDNQRVAEAKQHMLAIATDLLAQMNAAEPGVGLNKIEEIGADKHRQANMVQSIVLLNQRMVKESFNTVVPSAKIYSTDIPEIIIKQLTLETENKTNKLLIIKELTFQIYAYQISDECHIIVPQIYNIQFYKNEEDKLVCEFEMDYLNKWPDIISWIQNKEKNDRNGLLDFIHNVKRKLICLRENGIFHNDTHPDNILFLPPDEGSDIPKVAIIDFGKAMCGSQAPSSSGIYVPETNESEEEQITDFIKWIKKQQKKDLFNEKQCFGGKQKKKRKTCKKKHYKTYKKKSKKNRKSRKFSRKT